MKFCGKHIGEDDTFRVSTVAETIKKKKIKKIKGALSWPIQTQRDCLWETWSEFTWKGHLLCWMCTCPYTCQEGHKAHTLTQAQFSLGHQCMYNQVKIRFVLSVEYMDPRTLQNSQVYCLSEGQVPL